MKIVFLDGFTIGKNDVDFSSISALGEVEIYDFSTLEEAKLRIANAKIVVVNKFKVDKTILNEANKLEYIVVAATGYNNIDLEETVKRKIKVSNVKSYASSSVAQHVISSVLNVYNKTSYYTIEVANGRWQKSRDFCFYDHTIEELSGKTIGILGLGNIGKKLAQICHSFDMKVMALSRDDKNEGLSFVNYQPIHTIFKECDILSLHLPLNEQTETIINKDALDMMKKNAVLINTGRGGLINESELASHLIKHPEFVACLDVLTIEPPVENELIGLKNCLITPHLAWASRQARQRLIDGIAENIRAFKKGDWINKVGLS